MRGLTITENKPTDLFPALRGFPRGLGGYAPFTGRYSTPLLALLG
ncbi:hypothetical protein [Thermocladium modestius]|nr:hypothetical protein [Thermocladium modestius]